MGIEWSDIGSDVFDISNMLLTHRRLCIRYGIVLQLAMITNLCVLMNLSFINNYYNISLDIEGLYYDWPFSNCTQPISKMQMEVMTKEEIEILKAVGDEFYNMYEELNKEDVGRLDQIKSIFNKNKMRDLQERFFKGRTFLEVALDLPEY